MNSLGKDFWLYRVGQFLSVMGDYCGIIAISWWVLNKTGNARLLSIIISSLIFFQVILSPLMGPLGDRLKRKRLIIFSDIWRSLAFLLLAAQIYTDTFNVYLLVLNMLMVSIGSSLFSAIDVSFVSNIVPDEMLSKAIQYNQATRWSAQVLGTALGGVIVAYLGVMFAIIVNSATFILSALFTMLVQPIKENMLHNENLPFVSLWKNDFKAGIVQLKSNHAFLLISLFLLLVNFLMIPMSIIIPFFVKEVLVMTAKHLGYLQASMSIGVIAGSLLIDKIDLSYQKKVFGGMLMILISLLCMSFISSYYVVLAALFIIGFSNMMITIPMDTIRVLSVADAYRARSQSIYRFIVGSLSPLGILICGVILDNFNIGIMFLYMSLGMIICLLLLWKITPILWEESSHA